MKRCVRPVYRDTPSASVPEGDRRKRVGAVGKLSCDTGIQSMGHLRSWKQGAQKHGVRCLYLCGQSLGTDCLQGGERLLGRGPFLVWNSARSHQRLHCSSGRNKGLRLRALN